MKSYGTFIEDLIQCRSDNRVSGHDDGRVVKHGAE